MANYSAQLIGVSCIRDITQSPAVFSFKPSVTPEETPGPLAPYILEVYILVFKNGDQQVLPALPFRICTLRVLSDGLTAPAPPPCSTLIEAWPHTQGFSWRSS
jgi:hypothetical protein